MTNALVPIKEVKHDRVIVVAFPSTSFQDSLMWCKRLQRQKWNVGAGKWTEEMREALNGAYFSMAAVKDRVSPLMRGQYARLLEEAEAIIPERFLEVVELKVLLPISRVYEVVGGKKHLVSVSHNARSIDKRRRTNDGFKFVQGNALGRRHLRKARFGAVFARVVTREEIRLKVYFVRDAGVVWLQQSFPLEPRAEEECEHQAPKDGDDVFLKEYWGALTLKGLVDATGLDEQTVRKRGARMGLKKGRRKTRPSGKNASERATVDSTRTYDGREEVAREVAAFLDAVRQTKSSGVSLKEYVDDLYAKISKEMSDGKLKDDGRSYQVKAQPYEWAADRRRRIGGGGR